MKHLAIFLCLVAVTPLFADESSPYYVADGSIVLKSEPVASATPIPAGTPLPAVAVAEPAAPPLWAQEFLVAVQSLPVVGPVIAKLIFYLGIFASILTTLVVALLGVLNTLIGMANLTKLVGVANALAAFRDGKFMYWLTFFSNLNAKKPTPKY